MLKMLKLSRARARANSGYSILFSLSTDATNRLIDSCDQLLSLVLASNNPSSWSSVLDHVENVKEIIKSLRHTFESLNGRYNGLNTFQSIGNHATIFFESLGELMELFNDGLDPSDVKENVSRCCAVVKNHGNLFIELLRIAPRKDIYEEYYKLFEKMERISDRIEDPNFGILESICKNIIEIENVITYQYEKKDLVEQIISQLAIYNAAYSSEFEEFSPKFRSCKTTLIIKCIEYSDTLYELINRNGIVENLLNTSYRNLISSLYSLIYYTTDLQTVLVSKNTSENLLTRKRSLDKNKAYRTRMIRNKRTQDFRLGNIEPTWLEFDPDQKENCEDLILDISFLDDRDEHVLPNIWSEYPLDTNLDVYKGASLNQLVIYMICEFHNDVNFADFIITTYQSFSTPNEIFDKLNEFFIQKDTNIDCKGRDIQVNVIKFIKFWMGKQKIDFDMLIIEKLKEFVLRIKTDKELYKLCESEVAFIEININENLQTDDYTVRHIPGRYHSKLLNLINPSEYLWAIDSELLSHKLTNIDYKIFSQIKTYELLNKAWSDQNSVSIRITELISRFNSMSLWVASSILFEEKPKKRAKMIKNFIQLGIELENLNNYNSLMAVISGINNCSIRRLRKTFLLVPNKFLQLCMSILKCQPYLGIRSVGQYLNK
eukprot:TRINITY_DN8102_c0_g1_i2.p1 TRINITY_DN8102_c0_g1~~TRINITY_DN8102_c0_g1_i2.p1  ORF type:complete len:660 (-),score=109.47 TRINITY_DN8102_c0_g1_i2:325-2304(-)